MDLAIFLAGLASCCALIVYTVYMLAACARLKRGSLLDPGELVSPCKLFEPIKIRGLSSARLAGILVASRLAASLRHTRLYRELRRLYLAGLAVLALILFPIYFSLSYIVYTSFSEIVSSIASISSTLSTVLLLAEVAALGVVTGLSAAIVVDYIGRIIGNPLIYEAVYSGGGVGGRVSCAAKILSIAANMFLLDLIAMFEASAALATTIIMGGSDTAIIALGVATFALAAAAASIKIAIPRMKWLDSPLLVAETYDAVLEASRKLGRVVNGHTVAELLLSLPRHLAYTLFLNPPPLFRRLASDVKGLSNCVGLLSVFHSLATWGLLVLVLPALVAAALSVPTSITGYYLVSAAALGLLSYGLLVSHRSLLSHLILDMEGVEKQLRLCQLPPPPGREQ